MAAERAEASARYAALSSRYDALDRRYDELQASYEKLRISVPVTERGKTAAKECKPCETVVLSKPPTVEKAAEGGNGLGITVVVLLAVGGVIVYCFFCTKTKDYKRLDEERAPAKPQAVLTAPAPEPRRIPPPPSKRDAPPPSEPGTLRVLLQRAEGLKAADFMAKSDPYVILRVGKHPCIEKKSSTVRQNLNPVWNEPFEFEGVRHNFLSTGLLLAVFDWDKRSKDDPLGEVHVPMAELETSTRYEYAAKLPTKGTVFLTVEWIARGGSGAPPPAPSGGGSGGGSSGGSGGGSGGGICRVLLKRAENLKAADLNGRSDPYVIFECLRQTAKSKVVKYTLNPVWNETLEFRGQRAELLRTGLVMRVFDWDKRTSDDVLGEVHMPLTELEGEAHHDFAIRLPTKGVVHLAVEWIPDSGRVESPMQAADGDVSHQPSSGWASGFAARKRGATPPTNGRSAPSTVGGNGGVADAGRLQVLLVKAKGLKKADFMGLSDPYVILTLLGQEERSSVVKQNLNPVWNQTFEFRGLLAAFARTSLRMTLRDKDVVGKDDPLGEVSLPLALLERSERHEAELQLPAPYTGTVTVVLTWLSDSRPASDGLPATTPAGSASRPSPRVPDGASAGQRYLAPGKLRVLLQRAEGLKAADLNGKADPFVKLTCGRVEKKSKTVRSNLNPLWNETFEFEGLRPQLLSSGLHLAVLDWDYMTANDPLGEVHLSLDELQSNDRHAYRVLLPTKGIVFLTVEWIGTADVAERGTHSGQHAPPPMRARADTLSIAD